MQDWKVLLVDDEREFVSTLAERLSMRKMQVQVANDGEQALKKVETDPPQVVVLDLMMPGMSGLEVLDRIKGKSPEIEIILLTGMGGSAEAARGIHQGAFDCLVKPLNIDKLIERIGDALKKQSGMAS